ncbi:glucan endo-1,3-beta-glucosidase 8 [Citrus sinensis]|nr:glucan endo-1,3-beta-glucosidase 8 [Citrus sinensis]
MILVSTGALRVLTSHQLPSKTIVQMLKDNGISKVKLFDADQDTMTVLAGSDIEVMVAISNKELLDMNSWIPLSCMIKRNVFRYNFKGGVSIKEVDIEIRRRQYLMHQKFIQFYPDAVSWGIIFLMSSLFRGCCLLKRQGNGKWNTRHFRMLTATECYQKKQSLKNRPGNFLWFKKTFLASGERNKIPGLSLKVLIISRSKYCIMSIQNALNDAGVGDSVKASVPLNADVYESPENNPYPSFGRFRTDILRQTAQIVKFLAKNNVPFAVNIYPFPSLYGNDDFPFNYVFFDGALKAVDHGDMTVIVGEVGWPTDGDKNAKNVYWLLDEDAKCTDPGNFERHWGIFRYDGQSQSAMVLLVQGQNKMLKGARGVKYRVQGQNKMLKGKRGVNYMPSQWCMLNPGTKDMSKLVDNINYACTWLDCTALGCDFSCNNLDANGNASYAFNMFR